MMPLVWDSDIVPRGSKICELFAVVKVSGALGQKGVRNPPALMTAIDALVAAAGPVKAGVKLRISLGNLESGDANYANENGAIVAQPLGRSCRRDR
jgi:hypothetical protein